MLPVEAARMMPAPAPDFVPHRGQSCFPSSNGTSSRIGDKVPLRGTGASQLTKIQKNIILTVQFPAKERFGLTHIPNTDEEDLDLIRLTEVDRLLNDFEDQVAETVKLEPEVVSITSALPAKVYKTNDKISNSLPNLMGQGPQDLRIEGRDSPVEITTRVTLSWESLQSISKDLQMLTEDQRFSLFDRSVFDAVCSLFYSGTVYFTASTVFKTMTGKGPDAKVTESQRKAVTESIEKCRYCNITVDFSQESTYYPELKNINGDPAATASFSENLLNLRRMTIMVNGKKVEGWKILSKPMLFAYSLTKKQIMSFSSRLLNSPVSKKEDIIVIQDYLLRRIQQMRRRKQLKRSDHIILMDTIYKVAEIPKEYSLKVRQNKKRRLRDTIAEILKYWTEMEFIGGFEFLTQNREIQKILILLPGEKPEDYQDPT